MEKQPEHSEFGKLGIAWNASVANEGQCNFLTGLCIIKILLRCSIEHEVRHKGEC